jgi:hypothetical protein
MKRLPYILCLLWLAFAKSPTASGQTNADSTASQNSLIAVPLVFLTPETSWGFGAAGVYTFRLKGEPATSRPSQLQLGGAYTLENQILAYLPFQLFWQDEAYNTYGELGYYRYTYFYYGIGNDFEDYEGELFDLAYPRVRLNVAYKALGDWYLGLRYWMDDNRVSGTAAGGLLETRRPEGIDGGLLSGAGPLALLDQRDNVFYPTQGKYLELGLLYSGKAVGSDFEFTKYTVDARKYWSREDSEAVFALNAYLEFNTGQPPFTHLSMVGGTRLLRGYYQGRYRDRQMAILQAEYRFSIIWRFKGTVFGGLGNLADQPQDFQLTNTRYTLGLGLRFLLLKDEKAHVRVDYGFGKNTSGVYITVGEAF